MVDFAEGISDRVAGGRLRSTLQGKGAFRRFKNELYKGHPELVSGWQALRESRARLRAVRWRGAVRPAAGGAITSHRRQPTILTAAVADVPRARDSSGAWLGGVLLLGLGYW